MCVQSKPSSAPTPPRPTPPSPSVMLQHPGGQGPIYNTPYLSYVSQIHSVQVHTETGPHWKLTLYVPLWRPLTPPPLLSPAPTDVPVHVYSQPGQIPQSQRYVFSPLPVLLLTSSPPSPPCNPALCCRLRGGPAPRPRALGPPNAAGCSLCRRLPSGGLPLPIALPAVQPPVQSAAAATEHDPLPRQGEEEEER